MPENQMEPDGFEMVLPAELEKGSDESDQEPGDVKHRTLLQADTLTKQRSAEKDDKLYIKKNIQMRTCDYFMKKPNQYEKTLNLEKCKCGYRREEHSETALENSLSSASVEWCADLHTTAIPTNSYGKIDFVDYRNCSANYVRVAHDSPMDSIVQLFSAAWGKREMPNLLISVAGSVTDANMGRLTESFRRGLMKAAQSTGAWILTDGSNRGVTRHVGEAVRDYGLGIDAVTIGIANWGLLANKEQLIEEEGQNGMWPAKYKYKEKGNDEVYLEPHHTHFILVDNGSLNNDGVEIPFRAKFEKEIGKRCLKTGETVPVCLVVLGGGYDTLQTVHSALENGTPTVVLKGSGGAAEALAFANRNKTVAKSVDKSGEERKSFSLKPKYNSAIEKMMSRNGRAHGQASKLVKSCIEHEDLLSVFELDAQHSAKDVDLAIMKALLKAKKNWVLHQLKLAVAWNRMDMAVEAFEGETSWAPGQLDDVMFSAIQLNRVDFVKLFLEKDFSLKNFLTVERLLRLYESIPENCLLYRLLEEVRMKSREKYARKLSLVDVSNLIETLVKKPFKSMYLEGSGGNILDTDAAHELFIWATLMNFHKMSKVFWAESIESATARALFAQNLLSGMKKKTQDTLLAHELQSSIDDYGLLSVDLLNSFYKSNEKLTHKVLIRQVETWGNTSSLNLALQAENTSFVAQPACQSFFKTAWYGRIKTDVRLPLVMISTICPIFILFIGFTSDDVEHMINGGPRSRKKERVTPGRKVYYFFTSPIVKLCLNTYSHVAFLALFGYILLVQLSEEIHWLEIVLASWVATILIEEIRQFSASYGCNVKSMVRSYATDEWNILDIINIILFFVGYGLRLGLDMLDTGRVALSICFITFSLRILHVFSINRHMGPLLSMIYITMKDLFRFVAILMVFIVSYAVASEAILYPQAEISWEMLYTLPRKAYWHIYGDLFLEDIEGELDCTNDPQLYNNGTLPRCPSDVGRYVVPVLLGLYILMTNVMLLNILIATFSSIVQRIRDNVGMYWNLQVFNIVGEYIERPILPPPFIVISHLWMMGRKICTLFCCRERNTCTGPFCKKISEQEEVIQWENVIVYNYLDMREKDRDKLEELSHKVDLMMEKLQQFFDRSRRESTSAKN